MKSEYLKNVSVFAQIKPCKDFNSDHVKILIDKKSLCVRSVQDFDKNKFNDTPHYHLFKTDGVFCNELPEDIYKTVTQDLIYKYLHVNISITTT